MNKWFGSFIWLILVPALLSASRAWAADTPGRLQVADKPRTYIVHVPDGPPPPGGFPLLMAFHGGGMQGEGMRRLTRFDDIADARRFIAVYPDGIDKHWNDGRATIKHPQDDVGFVSALLDRMEQDFAIDRGRVYAAGISNGALFAERLGCELSGRIAAIAAVAGTLPRDLGPRCQPSSPVAVMQIDGTADPIMPFNGGAVADFGGRGEGGQVLSVADTVSFWARHGGCEGPATRQPLAPVVPMDGTRVLATRYAGCVRGGRVELLTVADGGHAWPGGGQRAPRIVIGVASRQIDASQAIAEFFLSLPAAP
jgi:polyhydroxybutyrate depolymerase